MKKCNFEEELPKDYILCRLVVIGNGYIKCDKTKCPMWATMKLLEKMKGGACE